MSNQFKQIVESMILQRVTEGTSYDDHVKRVRGIKKGSTVSFTSAKTGKKVSGTYQGLKQMSGRSYAHVEHKDGATYVPVHELHESVQINENVEDQQSELNDDFTMLIPHVKANGRAKHVDRFNAANDEFGEGYENDDDDKMYDGLDQMNSIVTHLKHHLGIDDVVNDTHLGKLMYHPDPKHSNKGHDFHSNIADAVFSGEHDALNKHVEDLNNYMKKHVTTSSTRFDKDHVNE